MELLQRLERIEEYVKNLKTKHDNLLTENVQLKRKVKNLEELLETKNQQLLNLEETNKISKLAGSVSNSNKSILKEQIDILLQEIDNCLTLVKK